MRAYGSVVSKVGALVLVAALGCTSNTNHQTSGGGGSGAAPANGGGGVVGGGGVAGAGGRALTSAPSQHRAVAAVCSTVAADAGLPTHGYDGGARDPVNPDGGGISCSASADCPACPNGLTDRCMRSYSMSTGTITYCLCDDCNSDQDCGPTGVCNCDGTLGQTPNIGNQCIAGNCRVDADCGPVGFCSPTFGSDNGVLFIEGYYCHTPKDQCRDDSDCPFKHCSYSPEAGTWTCFFDSVAG
jgi:hypothetical protein